MKIFGLLLILIFTSCVGTIEEEIPEFTQSNNIPTNPDFIFFGLGVGEVKAIAHNKVLLRFLPAVGGSGIFSYRVYTNSNLAVPSASFSSTQLQENFAGQLEIVVDNLRLGTNYSFIVRAFDLNSGVEDLNRFEVPIRTFDYYVPEFRGLKAVENSSGVAASSELELYWNEAVKPVNDPFGQNNLNPAGYNIYYSQRAEDLTNESLFGGSSISKVTVSSAFSLNRKITALSADTAYYFIVRAFDRSGNEEKNEKIIRRDTLSVVTDISFNGITSAVADETSCSTAKVDVTWGEGQGAFNRFFVVTGSAGAFTPSSVDPRTNSDVNYTVNTVTNLSSRSYTVNNLNFGSEYHFAVYACDSVDTNKACKSSDSSLVVRPQRKDAVLGSGITFENGILRTVELNLNISNEGCFQDIQIYQHSIVNGAPEADGTLLSTTVPSDNNNLYINRQGAFSRNVREVGNLLVGGVYYFSAQLINSDGNSIGVKTDIKRFEGTSVPQFRFSTQPTCSSTDDNGQTRPFSCSFSIEPLDNSTRISDFSNLYNKFAIAYNIRDNRVIQAADFTCGDLSTGSEECVLDTRFSQGNVDDNLSAVGTLSSDGTKINYSFPLSGGLAPNSIYSIGVIANTSIPGLSDFKSIVEGQTPAITAVHEGWFNIMALGPKIKRNVPVQEAMKLRSADDQGGSLLYPEALGASDILNNPGVTSSDRGIVVLEWNDFTLSNGQKFKTYYDNLTETEQENSGYRVYRYEASDPGQTQSSIDSLFNSGNNFTIVTQRNVAGTLTNYFEAPLVAAGAESLSGSSDKYFGRFIDYGVETGDSIVIGGEGLTYDINSSNEVNTLNKGKAYYYKVELFLNGEQVGTSAPNLNIISYPKVIVPPNNMALVHPWIANKAACDILQKPVDVVNNYRCSYNGLGHTQVNGQKYYDIGGFLFVDRFEMGVSYTRGDPNYTAGSGDIVSKGCRVRNNGNSLVLSRQTENVSDHFFGHPSHPRDDNPDNPNFEANLNGANRNTDLYVGDCAGSFAPQDLSLEALRGSVYVRFGINIEAYVQTAGATDMEYGNQWSLVSGRHTANSEQYARIFSNQAGIPAMRRQSYSKIQDLCQAREIQVDYSGGTSPKVNKSLLSRKEQIASFDYQPQLDQNTMTNLIGHRTENTTCNTNYHYGVSRAYRGNNSSLSISTGSVDIDASLDLRYSKFIRSNPFSGARFANSGTLLYSFLNTGSDSLDTLNRTQYNMFNSSQCITRYGIQDAYGNVGESLRDYFRCSVINGVFRCSSGYTDPDAQTGIITPEQVDWKSSDNTFFSLIDVDSFSPQAFPGYLGALASRDSIINMNSNIIFRNGGFYNTIMGMPLGANAIEDNRIHSIQSGFNYQNSVSLTHHFRSYRSSLSFWDNGAGGFFWPAATRDLRVVAGGDIRRNISSLVSETTFGRWGMMFSEGDEFATGDVNSESGRFLHGGRCSALVGY